MQSGNPPEGRAPRLCQVIDMVVLIELHVILVGQHLFFVGFLWTKLDLCSVMGCSSPKKDALHT